MVVEIKRVLEDAMESLQSKNLEGCRLNIEWAKESGRANKGFFQCFGSSKAVVRRRPRRW